MNVDLTGGRRICALAPLLLTLALGACVATGPAPGPARIVEGLALINRTGADVHDVRLSVPATDSVVACGSILDQTGCATTFPAREYRGNPVTVTWRQGGRSYSQAGVRFDAVADADPAQPLTAVVELARDGGVRARLLPKGR